MTFPNYLTLFRMFLTPGLAVAIVAEKLDWSLYLVVLAGFTDWCDGYMARRSNNVTEVGKVLDPLADKILILTVCGVFVAKGYFPLWMFIVILVRDVFITIFRQYALSTNRPLRTARIAKWKTAAQMTAIYLILIWRIGVEKAEPESLAGAMVAYVERWHVIYDMMLAVTLFTLFTGLAYVRHNPQLMKHLLIAVYRAFVPKSLR